MKNPNYISLLPNLYCTLLANNLRTTNVPKNHHHHHQYKNRKKESFQNAKNSQETKTRKENAIFFLLAPNNNSTPFVSFHQEPILPPTHSSKCFSSVKAPSFPPSFSASSSHHCSASESALSQPPQTTARSSTTPRRRSIETGRVAPFRQPEIFFLHATLLWSTSP